MKDHVFVPNRIGGGDFGPFAGDFAEIPICDRTLSDGERQTFDAYSGDR